MKYKDLYRRNLPHIRPPNSSFFLTDRLVDTLPRSAILRLSQEKKMLERSGDPKSASRLFKYLDELLDKGDGPTWLSEPRVASLVLDELRNLDENATLHAVCVMSNHTHALVSVGDEDAASLTEMMRSFKGRTARFANQLLGRTGKFWQRETYDHFVREGEWERILWYIAMNPVRAGLVDNWYDWPLHVRASLAALLASAKRLAG
jgi:putative transposase